MSVQLALSILFEAEQQQRDALDRHRTRVQTWFDELSLTDKEQLADMLNALEYDTCVALSAAAAAIGTRTRV